MRCFYKRLTISQETNLVFLFLDTWEHSQSEGVEASACCAQEDCGGSFAQSEHELSVHPTAQPWTRRWESAAHYQQKQVRHTHSLRDVLELV